MKAELREKREKGEMVRFSILNIIGDFIVVELWIKGEEKKLYNLEIGDSIILKE